MKYFTSLCLLIILGFSSANGQVETLTGQELSQRLRNLRGSSMLIPQTDTYIGSPYFTDWSKGYLILDNDKKTADMILRYNMANNSIQYVRGETFFAIQGKKINKYVIYTTDGSIVFKSGFSSQKYEINSNKLLRVIYNGKVKLLAHHTSNLLKNVPAYGVAGDVNEFTRNTDYFLVTADGTFHETDLDKRDILEILPGENKKMQAFAEKMSLEYNKQKELAKILAYYDLLLKAQTK